jgi:enamine deaminase RidA (YjgF/YER057c/UK114 family)
VPIHNRLTDVPDVPPGNGYSHAVVASGRTAYISGQIALDAQGQLVGAGDLRAQTAQCMRNLWNILRALGADWPDVTRFTWYLTDVSEVQVIRDVRDEFIRESLGERANPASSLIRVAGLVRPDLLVEVEAVAALP